VSTGSLRMAQKSSDIGRIMAPVRANNACRRLSMLFLAEYHARSDAQREERKWRKNGTSVVGIRDLAREQSNFTAVLKLDLVRIAISRRRHGNTRTGRTDSKNANMQGITRRRARDCRATLYGRPIQALGSTIAMQSHLLASHNRDVLSILNKLQYFLPCPHHRRPSRFCLWILLNTDNKAAVPLQSPSGPVFTRGMLASVNSA
jgi:hypothetical protein